MTLKFEEFWKIILNEAWNWNEFHLHRLRKIERNFAFMSFESNWMCTKFSLNFHSSSFILNPSKAQILYLLWLTTSLESVSLRAGIEICPFLITHTTHQCWTHDKGIFRYNKAITFYINNKTLSFSLQQWDKSKIVMNINFSCLSFSLIRSLFFFFFSSLFSL